MTNSITASTKPPKEASKDTIRNLWLYVLLNTLFRDIHEIFRPGFVDELAAGDLFTSDTALVVVAILLQLPLAMVVVGPLVGSRAARRANTIVAVVVAMGIAASWPKDADDVVFAVFQLLALGAIVALAADVRKNQSAKATEV